MEKQAENLQKQLEALGEVVAEKDKLLAMVETLEKDLDRARRLRESEKNEAAERHQGLVDKHAQKVPARLSEVSFCNAVIFHAQRVHHICCNGVEILFGHLMSLGASA